MLAGEYQISSYLTNPLSSKKFLAPKASKAFAARESALTSSSALSVPFLTFTNGITSSMCGLFFLLVRFSMLIITSGSPNIGLGVSLMIAPMVYFPSITLPMATDSPPSRLAKDLEMMALEASFRVAAFPASNSAGNMSKKSPPTMHSSTWYLVPSMSMVLSSSDIAFQNMAAFSTSGISSFACRAVPHENPTPELPRIDR